MMMKGYGVIMNSIEIWKDIEGYEGLYQISNMGRVRSLDRKDAREHRIKGKILAITSATNGYRKIGLMKDGNIKNHSVHRLVAKAFLDNPSNLPQVNHKDEDKTNNVVSNLEWCTQSYNNGYGTRNGRAAKANEKPIYVVTSSGNRYFFRSIEKAAELLGLSRGNVSTCLNGKRKHHHGFSFEWAGDPDD
ncbi:HNH endonuclease [Lactobacillus phage T25]|uniref:HNH endonuclease n=1 Tax=Lactobacillus phage T25 TaxID=2036055 RepID=A0A2Z6BEH0_9CAUD|nr:HNH endonuclease [Lactobacillus phage T25]BBD20125.1 HNH endonuclease [Lactobacillus phage T25]